MIVNKDRNHEHSITSIQPDEFQIIKVALKAFQRSGRCAFPFTLEYMTEYLDKVEPLTDTNMEVDAPLKHIKGIVFVGGLDTDQQRKERKKEEQVY